MQKPTAGIDIATYKEYNTSIRKELVPMGLITLKEYAERLGKNPVVARQKAGRGGFKTAQKIGRDWFIDENEPYEDNRIRSGAYKNWRKPKNEE